MGEKLKSEIKYRIEFSMGAWWSILYSLEDGYEWENGRRHWVPRSVRKVEVRYIT